MRVELIHTGGAKSKVRNLVWIHKTVKSISQQPEDINTMRLLYFFHTPQPKMRHRYSILLAITIHARTASYKSATFKIMCHITDMMCPTDLGTAITLSLFANNQEI